MERKKRLIYLEVLRIFSMFCVLFNHTGEGAFFYYKLSDNLFVQIVSIMASSFSKIGIPLFFMISGVLLLNRDEPFKDLYIKRILRYVIILLLFCSLYYIYQCSLGIYTFDFVEMFRLTTTGQMVVSYWFLYSYIGFLMSLPLLRKLARALSNSDYIYLFVIYVVVNSIFGVLARTTVGQLTITMSFATDLIMYPLLGYFLAYRIPDDSRSPKMALKFAMLGILGVLFNLGVTMYDHHIFLDWNEGGLLLFIIMPSAATFFLVKYFFDKVNVHPVVEKVLCFLGSGTFGMYILEPYIKAFFGPYVQIFLGFLSGIVLNLTYMTLILLIGCTVSALLRKLPLIRKIL